MNFLHKIISLIKTDDGNQKEISEKTLWSFFIQISAAGLVFISNIILARVMNVEEYGLYTFAFSLAILLSGLATSGYVNLFIRRAAGYTEAKQYALLKGLLNWGIKNILFISLAAALITLFVFQAIDFKNIPNHNAVIIALITVPISSLIIAYQSALNGTHFITQSQLPEKIIKPFAIISITLLFFFLNNKQINSETAAYVNIFATSIAFFYIFLSYKKNISGVMKSERPLYETKEWNFNYRGLLLLGILSIINTRVDVLIIGFLTRPDQVGIYNASARIAEIISFSLFVVNISLAPMISKLYSSGQKEDLQKLVTKTSRIVLMIAIPIMLILIFGGEYILALFGEKFKQGYHCLLVLSIAQFITIIAGSSGYLLTMTGNEKSATTAMLISLVLNTILAVIFIPRLGIIGAAYSTAISTIVWNICMAIFAKTKTGINPTFTGT